MLGGGGAQELHDIGTYEVLDCLQLLKEAVLAALPAVSCGAEVGDNLDSHRQNAAVQRLVHLRAAWRKRLLPAEFRV